MKFKFSLSTAFSVSVCIILFIFYTIMTFLYSNHHKQMLLDGLIDYGTTFTKDVAFMTSDMLVAENFIALEEYTMELSGRKNINRVTIATEEKLILADSDVVFIGENLAESTHYKCFQYKDDLCIRVIDEQQLIYFETPVKIYDFLIGYVVTSVSTTEIQSLYRDFMKRGVQVGVTALVIGLLVSIFVAKRVAAPIQKMMVVADEISKGNYIEIPQIDSFNEVDSLNRSLREMTVAIQNREIELKTTQTYLMNILESMPSMLITVDENETVTKWNQAITDFTGIPSGKAQGEFLYEMLPFLEKYSRDINAVLTTAEHIELLREKMIDGEERYFNLLFYPLMADAVTGVGIQIDDVTEMVSKNRQLVRAQKMETIGNLAGGLAHDFNNALGGVLGTLSLLMFRLENHMKMSDEELIDYLKVMESSGVRASNIVKQLLTMSKKHDSNISTFDLLDIFQSIENLAPSIFDKSIELIIDCPTEKCLINADKSQLEQVFINICINACHAMTIMRSEGERWGGKLSVTVDIFESDNTFRMQHVNAHTAAYFLVQIQDTGIGMSKNILEQIFDPFFTTKKNTAGTGLGLAMVYNIIQQHNGIIEVYSEEAMGTNFKVYLPMSNRTIQQKKMDVRQVSSHGKGTILVIDDEEMIRDTAKELLEELGYQVILAENGQDGVEQYETLQNSIDLVLLDMVMPVMSGKEAFIKLREINPNLKIILASGFRQDERVQEVIDKGVNDFLQKPYVIDTLAQAVSQVLNSAD